MEISFFIKDLIETADRQIKYGEFKVALVLLLIAIAASSKKMFPAGTPSIDNMPKNEGKKPPPMRDDECFTRFLESRLGRIGDTSLNPIIQEDGTHKRLNDDGTRNFDLPALWGPVATLIYKEIRCPIIHTGWVAADLECIDTLSDLSGLMSLEIHDGKIIFQRGLLDILREVVVDAPCNGNEFGKKHWRLMSGEGESPSQKFNDGTSFVNLLKNIGVPGYPGRVFVLAELLEKIGPDCEILDDDALSAKFPSVMNGSNSAGLASPGVGLTPTGSTIAKPEPWITRDYRLTDTGVQVAREILRNFSYVNISK